MSAQNQLRAERMLRGVVLAACAMIALVAAATLVGWITGNQTLKSFSHPNRIAMNPMTAVSLLLCAITLFMLEPPLPATWRRRTALACAAAVIFVSSSRLLQESIGFRIDQLLLPSQTNQMARNTAIIFSLLGIALISLDIKFLKLHVSQIPLAVAAGVTLLSLVGYLYDVQQLYRMSAREIPMALNTAVAFGILCIAILLARPQREPMRMLISDTAGGVMARRLLLAAFVLPVSLGWLAYRGEKRGWFNSDVRLCLLVLGNIIVFNALVWWNAKVQRNIDLRRRVVEEKLRQNEERYRAITEQAAEGIYLVDLESRRIIDSNAAIERLLGYQHSELESKTVYDLIDDTREGVDVRLARLTAADGPLRGERRYRRKDGSIVEVETGAGMISYAGRSVACTVVYDMTERKEAEEAIRSSENRLRLIIETANDAFVAMDDVGRIIDWNPRAERTFGWLLDEALGRVLADTVIPERFRAQHTAGLKKFLETGEGPVLGKRLELTALHRDGREFPIEITISPANVGDKQVFFAFIHDISARKAAEEERDRFFTLSRDMVSVGSFEGKFLQINPAFERVLGFTSDEILSKQWLDMIHPDDVERTIAAGEQLLRGETLIHFENRYLCKDGAYKWISWTSVPVVSERKIYGIARDMTERKRFEQELRDSAQSERDAHHQLMAAQSQLVQSEKLAGLGQMVAGVAHEINNPLSFVANNVAVIERDIKAIVELLKMYRDLEQQPELREKIAALSDRIDLNYTLENMFDISARSREGLRRIQQIVKDLRDFARLDASEVHEADINAGIESTINIIRGRAKKKSVEIQTDFSQVPPIMCYPAKINQVVMNLIANAIDASPEGGQVMVRSSSDDAAAQIEVIDQGGGIDEKIREKIFDPFFTTKPPGEGTGLGLSISYGIIQDHGGTIGVESEQGKGTKFIVRVPKVFQRAKS